MSISNSSFIACQHGIEDLIERDQRKKDREEYLKLLEEYGITEQEDEALTDVQYSLCEFI